MSSPENLKYTKEHEWVKVEDDIATIGITFHAQELLTDIVFVELPEAGKTFDKDGVLGTVESVKSVSDIFSPIGGEVTDANAELESQPELVNQDPYEKGWMVKIKISDKAELDSLMSAEEYEKLIGGD